MNAVQDFYNRINFPGQYTIEQLKRYGHPCENFYLKTIEKYIIGSSSVLDAGCGTGLISNLFGFRHPNIKFDCIDFSSGIDYAQKFAVQHNLNNISYIKADLNNYHFTKKYDVVLCQGVLHHIPDYKIVLEKLQSSVNNHGKLILGLYHPAGKIVKKLYKVNYQSEILSKDQEENPFELSFTVNQVKNLTQGWELLYKGPTFLNMISIPAFFNYRSGGLVLYVLGKK